jgi:metal-responsive CopG/Arc/MetJ family transcriptional regulator
MSPSAMLSVRMPIAMVEQLEERADEDDKNRSQLIREAVAAQYQGIEAEEI